MIDKIYFYAKDLREPKCEFLIKKCEYAGTKHFSDSNGFNECSNTMDDVYENIDDYNPNSQRKILIVFDDMIADIKSNKKFQAIIKELFIRCRKLNILVVFITQSYKVSKAAKKKRVIIITSLSTLFINFTETLKNLKECH